MRYLLVAVLVAGCATTQERDAKRVAIADREMAEAIKVQGPACEKLGYSNGSDGWRDCVIRLSDRRR